MRALRPMQPEEYVAWRDASVRGYGEEKVRSGQWPADGAAERSRQTFASLVPQGLATPGHAFHTIVNDEGHPVGSLWIAEQDRGGAKIAYVYDIVIAPEYRRQGHAARALQAVEAMCRERGWAGIGLHVFGHNLAARRLYADLGFTETNVNMFKPIDD